MSSAARSLFVGIYYLGAARAELRLIFRLSVPIRASHLLSFLRRS